MLDPNLLEIYTHREQGYTALFDFETWRIGYMNDTPIYAPEKIDQLQRHELCDEIFVLLQGACCLIVSDQKEDVGTILLVHMEPLQVYNIKKGVWHSHIMEKGTSVFIVENSNTGGDNSPFIALSPEQQKQIQEEYRAHFA